MTLTRSIIARGFIGRLLSLTMLHEDNHGAHQFYPKTDHRQLPDAIEHMYDSPLYQPRQPIYSSYLHALIDMLPHLANPRAGAQWVKTATKAAPPLRPAYNPHSVIRLIDHADRRVPHLERRVPALEYPL